MSRLYRFAIVATLCGVAGCNAPPQTTPEPKEFGYKREGSIGPTVYRGLIEPANGGAVRGSVEITPDQGGSTSTATIDVVGPPTTYTWHVDYGSCLTADAALLGSKGDYTTFQVVPSGNGHATATLRSVPSGGNFHVVVQASDNKADQGHVVGCGEVLDTGV
jgi:hypothetical protein